jgi:hypothetical protein
MLSLKYYKIVHKADTKDYIKSLRAANELDKNDFRYSTYAVKLKLSVELSIVPQSR